MFVTPREPAPLTDAPLQTGESLGRASGVRPGPVRPDVTPALSAVPSSLPVAVVFHPRWHDARKSLFIFAARNLVHRNVPGRVAMAITGHFTRSVFDRYNIVSDGDLREAAKKLSASPAGGHGHVFGHNSPARKKTRPGNA